MTHFPISVIILALAVTANPVVKIGNLESLTPAKISGQVYMNDENTIVIKDFKIERNHLSKVLPNFVGLLGNETYNNIARYNLFDTRGRQMAF